MLKKKKTKNSVYGSKILQWTGSVLAPFFPIAHNRNPKKPIPAGTETSLDRPFILSHCTPDLRGSA